MMICLLMALSALAAEQEVTSKVSEVTVYNDRARVTRVATVDVPAGRTDLVFDGLSLKLIQDSLSAEGAGNAGAILTGIDVVTKRGTEDRDEQSRTLKAEREALQRKIAAQNDIVTRVDGQITFLKSVKPTAPSKLTEAMFLADDAPQQLTELARNLGEDLRALYAERRAATLQIRELNNEVSRIDRELALLKGGSGPDHRRVAVGVDAKRAGRLTVELSYVVTQAQWTPRYDARYSLTDGKVRLDVSGAVTQTTGEDWTGVQLTLSTAKPQKGTTPPVLTPFVLREGGGGGGSYGGMPGGATVSDKVTAFEFAAKRTEDVPSDGNTRRVPLNSVDLTAKVVHKVVPRREPVAYLVGRIEYDGDFTLLPGPVSSYLGSAYVGQGNMALTPPGGELDLSFGVDDRVAVKREVASDVQQDAKLGNRDRRRWAWDTTVENHTGKAIDLVVVDQIPASRVADWKVEASLSPEVDVPADGVFEWRQEVGDDQEAVFHTEYELSWPEGNAPMFLD